MKAPDYQISVAEWQMELSQAMNNLNQLLNFLNLKPEQIPHAIEVAEFPLRVPYSFATRMQKCNPHDPLLLQVLPSRFENDYYPGFNKDALEEEKAKCAPGLLHKYKDRVLFIPIGACAIHCRYCFRRHFPYEENGRQGWDAALDYIEKNTAIKEVILSGGDPLLLKDNLLAQLVNKIDAIKHVQRIRFHTRLPIAIPSRITDDFLELFSRLRTKIVMVLHCNHPNEINIDVEKVIKKLLTANMTVLNQAVLLKNINDSTEVLIKLSEKLFAAGSLPYYLHLLDRVQGTGHFEVSEEIAKKIIWEMMQNLPGYLVPKLVREVPGAPAKMPITIL